MLIGPQPEFASSSDRLTDELPEFTNQVVRADKFWVQCLSARKSEKLRCWPCPPGASPPWGGCEPLDLVIVRRIFDEFQVPGNHRKQVVEIVRDAARELADGFHLLALMKLLFGHAARLHGVLVLGDVPEEDRETFAGRECIERVPDAAARAAHF